MDLEGMPQNVTARLFALGEVVEVAVTETAGVAAAKVAAHFGVTVPADAVVEAAALASTLVFFLACCACRATRRASRNARARTNKLILEMAAQAPEDDGEEHEIEQHTHFRGPAPGDSDLDDDLVTDRTRAPASACK